MIPTNSVGTTNNYPKWALEMIETPVDEQRLVVRQRELFCKDIVRVVLLTQAMSTLLGGIVGSLVLD